MASFILSLLIKSPENVLDVKLLFCVYIFSPFDNLARCYLSVSVSVSIVFMFPFFQKTNRQQRLKDVVGY